MNALVFPIVGKILDFLVYILGSHTTVDPVYIQPQIHKAT